jgi:hypothetical protein
VIRSRYHCDGPDCERSASDAAQREVGGRFLTITGYGPTLHFCGWDCVLRYAGRIEPETIVYMDDPDA